MSKKKKIIYGSLAVILLFVVGFLIYRFVFCDCGVNSKVDTKNPTLKNSYMKELDDSVNIKNVKTTKKVDKNITNVVKTTPKTKNNSSNSDKNISVSTKLAKELPSPEDTASLMGDYNFKNYSNDYSFIFDNLELIRDNKNLKIKFLKELKLDKNRISWLLKLQFKGDVDNNFIVTMDRDIPVIVNINRYDNSLILYKYNKNLHFKYNKFTLYLEDENQLKQFFANLDEIKSDIKGFIVQGFTDDIGSEEFNLVLSMKRSQILNQKLEKYSDNIINLGYGKRRNLVSNDTKNNKKLNRRIEVIVIY